MATSITDATSDNAITLHVLIVYGRIYIEIYIECSCVKVVLCFMCLQKWFSRSDSYSRLATHFHGWWRHDKKPPSVSLTICDGNRAVFPSQTASNAFFMFLCCKPEQVVQQTVELSVIWGASILMLRHCNSKYFTQWMTEVRGFTLTNWDWFQPRHG